MSDTPLKIPYVPHVIDPHQGAVGFLDKIKEERKTIKEKLANGESITIPSEESARPISSISNVGDFRLTRYLTDTIVENMAIRYLMLGGPMQVFNLTGTFTPPVKDSPLYIEPILYLYEACYMLGFFGELGAPLFSNLYGGYKTTTTNPCYYDGVLGEQFHHPDISPPLKISADLIMLLLYKYAQACVVSPIEGASDGAKLGYFLCSEVPSYNVSNDYSSAQEDKTVATYRVVDGSNGDSLETVSQVTYDPEITSPFKDENNNPILTDKGKEVGQIIQETAEPLNTSIFWDASTMFTDFSHEVNTGDPGAKLSCTNLSGIADSLENIKCVHASLVNTDGSLSPRKLGISSFRTKGVSYTSVAKLDDTYVDLRSAIDDRYKDESRVNTYDLTREYTLEDNSSFEGGFYIKTYTESYAYNRLYPKNANEILNIGYGIEVYSEHPAITSISGEIYMFIRTDSLRGVNFDLTEGAPPVTPGKYAHLKTYQETTGTYRTNYETDFTLLHRWPSTTIVAGLTETNATKRINHIFTSDDIVFEYVGFSDREDVNAEFYQDGRELSEKTGNYNNAYIVYKATLASIYKAAGEKILAALNTDCKAWETHELENVQSSSCLGSARYLNYPLSVGSLSQICSLDIEIDVQFPRS